MSETETKEIKDINNSKDNKKKKQTSNSKERMGNFWACLVISAILVIVVTVTGHVNFSIINDTLLTILAIIYLAVFTYYIFINYAVSRFIIYRRKVFSVVTAIVLTGLFVLFMPNQYEKTLRNNIYEKATDGPVRLTFTATGQKNKTSTGTDFYLEGVQTDETDLNIFEFNLPDGWEFKDDRPYTDGSNTNTLIVDTVVNDTLKVYLRTGRNMGIVKIGINDVSGDIDLYRDKDDARAKIDLRKVCTPTSINIVEKIIYYIAYVGIAFILMFSATMFLYKFVIREKFLTKQEKEQEKELKLEKEREQLQERQKG